MTAFSYTADSYVHNTQAGTVVRLARNLYTMLTLKKIANAWNAVLYRVRKKYVT
jgi:hypothetical protein